MSVNLAGQQESSIKTVLIADDEPVVRLIVEKILRSAGYHVITAESGDAARETAARHTAKIDILISDIVMPGVSGVELARHLQSSRPETKVLLISGYTPDEVEFRSGWKFLSKPFSPAGLTQAVAGLLRAA